MMKKSLVQSMPHSVSIVFRRRRPADVEAVHAAVLAAPVRGMRLVERANAVGLLADDFMDAAVPEAGVIPLEAERPEEAIVAIPRQDHLQQEAEGSAVIRALPCRGERVAMPVQSAEMGVAEPSRLHWLGAAIDGTMRVQAVQRTPSSWRAVATQTHVVPVTKATGFGGSTTIWDGA